MGIDGCKSGWVVASSNADLTSLRFEIAPQLAGMFANADRGVVFIAIDIPIGLSTDGLRACDVAARQLLSKRHKSSVFPAPCRAALRAADDYQQACALSRAICGRSLSRQSHGILRKIREVDELMTPERQARIREAHPEVTFATLAGRGLRYSKKCADGWAERLRLLRRVGLRFDPARERFQHGCSRVAPDDIIDAAACLVTAWRVYREMPREDVEIDQKGLRMEIVA
jgi:predicted RNase H-like nuclease